ncbi:hypothetical protein BDF22DRAFT_674440 [Syncephalis plumigaleata]|nr:hypothetical protein BDF22DRAFT_674440 [Syncephalis plumigaleata]
MRSYLTAIAFVASLIISTLSTATADPTGYPGQDAFRIDHGGKCMKLRKGNDPWFETCNYEDSLDFAAMWTAVQVGEYFNIKSVESGKCLYEGRPATMKDCSDSDGNNLWRFFHGDDYDADEQKIITKSSDDRNNGGYTCISYDKTVFFEGHTVTFACNRNDRNQFFKKNPVAALPRY